MDNTGVERKEMDTHSAVTFAIWMTGITAGLSSIPHCLGMCGPIVAMSCNQNMGRNEAKGAIWKYQLGRLISYTLLGTVAGLFSEQLFQWLPGQVVKPVISVMIGVSLLIAAFRLWRASRKSSARILKKSADKPLVQISKLQKNIAGADKSSRTSKSKWNQFPFALGLLTAFIPCGALASALLLTMGSGKPWVGATTMALFSLSSGLGFWALGWLTRMFHAWQSVWSKKVLSIVFAFTAIFVFVRAFDSIKQNQKEGIHANTAYSCPHHREQTHSKQKSREGRAFP